MADVETVQLMACCLAVMAAVMVEDGGVAVAVVEEVEGQAVSGWALQRWGLKALLPCLPTMHHWSHLSFQDPPQDPPPHLFSRTRRHGRMTWPATRLTFRHPCRGAGTAPARAQWDWKPWKLMQMPRKLRKWTWTCV